jgi:hypothetical protein
VDEAQACRKSGARHGRGCCWGTGMLLSERAKGEYGRPKAMRSDTVRSEGEGHRSFSMRFARPKRSGNQGDGEDQCLEEFRTILR